MINEVLKETKIDLTITLFVTFILLSHIAQNTDYTKKVL